MRSRRISRNVSPWTRSSSIVPADYMLPDRSDSSVQPSPNKLRRAVADWLPLGNARLIGKVTVLQHGGSQRPVVHRGSKHARFRFVSAKTKSTQLGEGHGEEALAYLNEVSAHVLDYECHPFQFQFMVRNKLVNYRVDNARYLDTGGVDVIEVKRDRNDLADPDLRETLALAKELCREIGWTYAVQFEDEILGGEARQMNVAALFGRRSMKFTSAENRVAGHVISRGHSIQWGELRDMLAPGDALQGDAVIEGLIARGSFSIDLDRRPTPRTILTPHRKHAGGSLIRI